MQFKLEVGAWVYSSEHPKPIQIENLEQLSKCKPEELWKPTEGEYCTFYSPFSDKYIVKKFYDNQNNNNTRRSTKVAPLHYIHTLVNTK